MVVNRGRSEGLSIEVAAETTPNRSAGSASIWFARTRSRPSCCTSPSRSWLVPKNAPKCRFDPDAKNRATVRCASSNQRNASPPKYSPTRRRISRVASSRGSIPDASGPSGCRLHRSLSDSSSEYEGSNGAARRQRVHRVPRIALRQRERALNEPLHVPAPDCPCQVARPRVCSVPVLCPPVRFVFGMVSSRVSYPGYRVPEP
jgi:hypothetical protein